MNTSANPNCMSQFTRVIRILVWSGLGICIAAATAYDVTHWMFG